MYPACTHQPMVQIILASGSAFMLSCVILESRIPAFALVVTYGGNANMPAFYGAVTYHG